MTNYEPGDVVDVPFPFVDLPIRKRRPALVLGCLEEAAILAMVTSAKRSAWSTDTPVTGRHEAGLHAPSVVRLKLFSIEPEVILSRRGSLSADDRAAVAAALRESVGLLRS